MEIYNPWVLPMALILVAKSSFPLVILFALSHGLFPKIDFILASTSPLYPLLSQS